MTANQIALIRANEDARSNRASEELKAREIANSLSKILNEYKLGDRKTKVSEEEMAFRKATDTLNRLKDLGNMGSIGAMADYVRKVSELPGTGIDPFWTSVELGGKKVADIITDIVDMIGEFIPDELDIL